MHNNAGPHSQYPRPTFFGGLLSQKSDRQAAILELIGRHDVRSHEDLRQLLERRGIDVTQATLSRDLRDIGIVRVSGDDGARYTKPSLETLLPQLFSRVDGVGELVVLHTLASGAQPISEAIDAANWREVLGTVAGENTILIICRSATARQTIINRLSELARGNQRRPAV
jgi:transcriptional regulator of arginine metabolism